MSSPFLNMDEHSVCPESTLESVSQRDSHEYKTSDAQPKSKANPSGTQACESTIESANRRNFIKKAALLTSVAAVGSTAVGSRLIPESSAKSQCNVIACFVIANDGVFVDANQSCNGNPLIARKYGLLVGYQCPYGLGQMIGSQTNCNTICGYAPGGNLHGLDFYTDFAKRMSISNTGYVGIGTCKPENPLCVVGGVIMGKGGVNGIGPTMGIWGTHTTCSACAYGVYGIAHGQATGVFGAGCKGPGVVGQSFIGIGLEGRSSGTLAGKFKNYGSTGDRTALVQFETGPSCKLIDWNIGIAGACNAAKIPDGSFYFQHPGVSAIGLTINKCGYVGINNTNPERRLCITGRIQASCGVGIGTQTINTTLAVNGSIAAKTRVVTSCTTISASDFAVFANGKATLKLPPASTQNGMLIFIKNVSTASTTPTVTIEAAGTDTIEGAATKTLTIKYSSLTIVSNGTNEWYVLSNAA